MNETSITAWQEIDDIDDVDQKRWQPLPVASGGPHILSTATATTVLTVLANCLLWLNSAMACSPEETGPESPRQATPPSCDSSVVAPNTLPQVAVDHDDLLLSESTSVRRGLYSVVDENDSGVIRITGDDLLIDGQGATLDGAASGQPPDALKGYGIVIENSKNVTLRNFVIRGYKVGILAKNCSAVLIEDCDVSDNWKMHLRSTPEAEDGADWLFGQENDGGEWLRYGSGIYIEQCQNSCLRQNHCHRGQNGICISQSFGMHVYDNDMSFNSGWGIALYRTCRSQISRNKCDWCIRGYSHGVYNRGQDSAGILVYEQSSDNTFAFNSATHSGDGFFLFAGNETLKTGAGGCNRNLIIGNDFSHSSNNGIEATFSAENRFVDNKLDQADHAIWAGYSYNNVFVGNQISHCNHGISIEHGNGNWIEGNSIRDTGIAIFLWANATSQFSAGPFGKSHSCLSQDYTVARNRLQNNPVQMRLQNTHNVTVRDNEVLGSRVALELDGECRHVNVAGNNLEGRFQGESVKQSRIERNHWVAPADRVGQSIPQPLPIDFKALEKPERPVQILGSLDTHLAADMPRGLEYILVDEWGPYDFREPKLIPTDVFAWNEASVRILAAKGQFAVEGIHGNVQVQPQQGTVPATIRITATEGKSCEFSLSVRLNGAENPLPCRGTLLESAWDVRHYVWQDAGPQTAPTNWAEVTASPIVEKCKVPAIDFRWQLGGLNQGATDHFATVATTDLLLPPGSWEVSTISDDGVRVFVDDQLVIDNWTWHGPSRDVAKMPVSGGTHAIKIEHFEIDGWAQLQFLVRRMEATVTQ